MGKKYIIELEDKPFHKEDGDFIYRVKGFNSLVFDMTGISKLTPYAEPDLSLLAKENFERGYRQRKAEDEKEIERVRKEAYDKGYHDGHNVCYENAKDLMEERTNEAYLRGLSDAWEAARKIIRMPEGDLLNLFDVYSSVCTPVQVMLKYDASEAIEKLKAYEEKQETIQIGDEVAFRHDDGRPDTVVVVTYIGEDGFIDGMDGSGTQYAHKNPKKWTKTGRHFPDIATVLKKMKEVQK